MGGAQSEVAETTEMMELCCTGKEISECHDNRQGTGGLGVGKNKDGTRITKKVVQHGRAHGAQLDTLGFAYLPPSLQPHWRRPSIMVPVLVFRPIVTL